MLQASGLGDGVVNVIQNAPQDAVAIVKRLIANPSVRRVNFTGYTRVGRIVGSLCGQHLKPCVLEPGGKALALDLCERIGLPLPQLSDATSAALSAVLPDLISPSNPLDVTAQSVRSARWPACLPPTTANATGQQQRRAELRGHIRRLQRSRWLKTTLACR